MGIKRAKLELLYTDPGFFRRKELERLSEQRERQRLEEKEKGQINYIKLKVENAQASSNPIQDLDLALMSKIGGEYKRDLTPLSQMLLNKWDKSENIKQITRDLKNIEAKPSLRVEFSDYEFAIMVQQAFIMAYSRAMQDGHLGREEMYELSKIYSMGVGYKNIIQNKRGVALSINERLSVFNGIDMRYERENRGVNLKADRRIGKTNTVANSLRKYGHVENNRDDEQTNKYRVDHNYLIPRPTPY